MASILAKGTPDKHLVDNISPPFFEPSFATDSFYMILYFLWGSEREKLFISIENNAYSPFTLLDEALDAVGLELRVYNFNS